MALRQGKAQTVGREQRAMALATVEWRGGEKGGMGRTGERGGTG